MIGTLAVSVTFGASTASRPMRTPSTMMQREPMKAPSSTITGRAPAGSSTPPEPGFTTDAHALDCDAARPDEGAVLDDHGTRARWLEAAADADAACEVDV